MRKGQSLALLVLASVLAVGIALASPFAVLTAGGVRVGAVPALSGEKLQIRFIHSVQKTPVEENFTVEKEGFVLHSTRYLSFGVGLPFLAEEGEFHFEDGAFVLDHMERHFPRLSLRTGVGTRLQVTFGAREYPLYEVYKPGTRIDIEILPAWKMILLKGR